MSSWSSLGFQDASSFFMEQLLFFHDHSMLVLLVVSLVVLYYVLSIFFSSYFDRFVVDGHEVEFIWTVLPCFLLVFIAFPSLNILYIIDDLSISCLTFNGAGYQWYWVYEYSDLFSSDFGSYPNLLGDFRLLDCDDRLVLPFSVPLRMLVTSGDVIHSWTVPSFGIKADAVPGRLNQLFVNPLRLGFFVGQCSEICGSGHSFIPIVVEVVPVSYFY